MHIFVTGGTGFFGKALLRYWSGYESAELSNARFTLLSRNPEKFRSANGRLISDLNAQLIQGDILKPESLPEDNYTHIIHAATDSTTGLQLSPLQRFEQIVQGTRNVLELARRCNKPRILMTSSGGVYGNISNFKAGVPESYFGMPDPLIPDNAYSIAKRQAEHLCALYYNEYNIKYIIARCFAFVGEDLPLNAHFAIGNFIRNAIAGDQITIQGNGAQVRSYMDQRDLARWLTVMLLHAEEGRVYNVGSSEPTTLFELANRIAAMSPRKNPGVNILNRQIVGQSTERSFYLPNIDRAREELGLNITIGLDDSVRYVIERM